MLKCYSFDQMAFFIDGNFHDGGLTRQKFNSDYIRVTALINSRLNASEERFFFIRS